MKKILFSTVGIALALLLTGCPTGIEDSVAKAHKLDVDDINASGTDSISVVGGLVQATKDTSITLDLVVDTNRKVELTAVPAVDFSDANGAITDPYITSSGDITFVMPDEAVTITATFMATGEHVMSVTSTDGVTGEDVTSSTKYAKENDPVTLTVSGLDNASPARQVTLSSTPVVTFTDALGNDLGTLPVVLTADGEVTFTMPAEAVDITATFGDVPPPTKAHELDVDDINASGTDSISVVGGLLQATKDTTVTLDLVVDTGRKVELTAVPAVDFSDANGAITDPYITSSGDITFVMPDEAVTITATFMATGEHVMSVTSTDGVTGEDVTPSTKYAKENDLVTLTVSGLASGRKVTFSATLADNTAIVFTPAELTADGEVTFTMPTEAVDITATFAPVPPPTYAVTVDVTPGSNANESVVATDPDVSAVVAGATVTLTVQGLGNAGPNSPRQVTLSSTPVVTFTDASGTLGDSPIITADGEVTFTMPAEAVTITATFAPVPPPTYAVDITPHHADPAHGEMVTANPANAVAGATVTLTVQGLGNAGPNSPRQVTLSSTPVVTFTDASGTLGNSPIITADGEVTFTMPAEAVDITATFAPVPPPTHAVTVNDDGTGISAHGEMVTANPANAVAGATVTLTVQGLGNADPDSPRQVTLTSTPVVTFTDASGNDLGDSPIITADGEVTFTMPAEAVTITATFAPVPPEKYSLRAPDLYNTIPSDSLIYSDGLIEAEAGDTVTLELTLDTDRKVKLNVFEATGNGNSIVISYEDGPQATEFYITASGNLTFPMPATDVSIEAHFMNLTEQMITVLPSGIDLSAGETITPESVGYASQNTEYTIEVAGLAVNRQVNFTSITGPGGTVDFDKSLLLADGAVSFTVPETFVTITANFEDKTPHSVEVRNVHNVVGVEAVTPNVNSAVEGQEVTLTIVGMESTRKVTLHATKTSDSSKAFDYFSGTSNPGPMYNNGKTRFFMPGEDVTITATFSDN